MTRDELRAAWARWSHRLDLDEDMATIEELAAERIRDRMMVWGVIFPDAAAVEASMAEGPALWMAAGLIEIFRLADDAEAMSREATLFEQAAADFILRASLRAGPAIIGKQGAIYDGN